MSSGSTETRPGIHPQFATQHFSPEEQAILRKLSHEWLITSGAPVQLASSRYLSFLMKPTRVFSEMFNVDREIIAVFSPYPRFEPRTLDAFDSVQRRLSDLRVESVCRVLISKDPEVESKIESLLKTDPEQPIVIPFTYEELSGQYDDFFLRNRFRKHFYTRDLFAFLSPLRKDLYFFGRSELIQEIVNKHRSGEHTGLFGLRKSGKTSIVYAIERHMTSHGEAFLSIDCESPSVHKLRWYELLEKLVRDYKQVRGSKTRLPPGERYTEKLAADSFAEDVLRIHRSKKARSVLLLFDEIERISPCTGSSAHWRDGEDFVYFWQTLRGFYQRNPDVLTYMLVGTNPSCVELPVISGHENPLFSSIPSQYVPPFTVEQVRQMVRRLGRYVGLQFDELIYAKLCDDFGGHPFLIRQICSLIHRSAAGDRPLRVDKALYQGVKKEFTRSAVDYLEMIVQVLQDWYPDEYDMLRFLAQGDDSTFAQFARDHERYTRHLIGYGLIEQGATGYCFKVEAVRTFLETSHRYERLNLTDEEKRAEISLRRNRIERGLRGLVRNTLRTAYGKKKASERVLAAVPESRRSRLRDHDIDALLDPESSGLFFLELIQLIERDWDVFQNILEMDKDEARVLLNAVNRDGRPDAHAKAVDADTFAQLRLHFKKLEGILEEWGL
jgi:hypothetical protein